METNGQHPGGAEEPQSQRVEDSEGRLRQRRLDDIHEARRRVHETINKVEEAKLGRDISKKDANSVVRRAVENYIRETRYPLKNTEAGKKYWEEYEIETLKIPAPSAAQLAWKHKLDNEIGHPRPGRHDTSTLPGEYELRGDPTALEPKVVQFKGLKSIFDAPNPIKTTYSLRFHVRFRGVQQVSKTVPKQIPRDILLKFFDVAIDASGEIGLEADLDDEDGDGGFDLEDVGEVDLE